MSPEGKPGEEVIVDMKDNITGYKPWRERTEDDIYRVSSLWIVNSNTNEALLAQRSFSKKVSPGVWSMSVTGTVEYGETYESNIIKEAREEVGLTITNLIELDKAYNERSHKFQTWFLTDVDLPIEAFRKQDEEVEAIKWVKIDELLNEYEQNPADYSINHKVNVQLLLSAIESGKLRSLKEFK